MNEARPLLSGRLELPELDRSVPSEVFARPSLREFWLSTLPRRDRSGAGPLHRLTWKDSEGLRLSTPAGLRDFRASHIRNMASGRQGENTILVFADHGPDAEPFPGARSILMRGSGERWDVSPLASTPAFHFDATMTDTLGEDLLLVLINLQSTRSQVFAVDRNGVAREIEGAWPEACGNDGSLSAVFADFDGDGEDELWIGSRNERERDVILKWHDGRFLWPEQRIPRKARSPWETVQSLAVDLDNDGRPDVITLNHDLGIRHGAVEAYLNRGELHFETMPLEPSLEALSEVDNRWLHRLQAVDWNGDGFIDFVVTCRKADHGRPEGGEPVFLIRNEGGRRLSLAPLRKDDMGWMTASACVDDFNGDGRMEILRIGFDGSWRLDDLDSTLA